MAWWKGDSVVPVWTFLALKLKVLPSGDLLSPKESGQLPALIWGWAESWEINLKRKPSSMVAGPFQHLVPLSVGGLYKKQGATPVLQGPLEPPERNRPSVSSDFTVTTRTT